MRHTGEVRQSSLSTDEGGAANGCAHGGCGANGGAYGAGAEESSGHYVVCYGGCEVERRVVWLQWAGRRETRSASKCTERKEAQSSASTRRHPKRIRMASTPCRRQHRDTEQLHVLSIIYIYMHLNGQPSDHGGQYDVETVRSAQADTPSKWSRSNSNRHNFFEHAPSVCLIDHYGGSINVCETTITSQKSTQPVFYAIFVIYRYERRPHPTYFASMTSVQWKNKHECCSFLTLTLNDGDAIRISKDTGCYISRVHVHVICYRERETYIYVQSKSLSSDRYPIPHCFLAHPLLTVFASTEFQ
jgi:hypothetical protein